MTNITYRAASKVNYSPPIEESVTGATLQIGALLRIADSLEVVARNYNVLLADVAYLRRRCEELEVELKTERRRVAAYRGRIHMAKK